VIEIRPSETALLVIDPQNAFCHPEGTLGKSGVDVTPLTAVVPQIVELMRTCDAREIPVICTQHTNELDDAGRARHRIEPHTAKRATLACQPGTWDAAFVAEVSDALPAGAHVVAKHRWSAFFSTQLDGLLQVLGTRLLIVTGTTTNACIETTVRDAYMRDFDVVIPRECVAGVRQEWHEVALAIWERYVGEVVGVDELRRQLAPARVAM
jgi:ureidoacrylate peracid hydrolase